MPKQYGLILPGRQKKPTVLQQKRERPSIFDEDSDSDTEPNAPQLKPRTIATKGPGAMERRIARKVQEKALEEDPTVFQYDELYDEMETKRETEKQTKAMEPKKPKYIARLLETAEKRKLENELRIERQVQKDREAEGDEFKDKETFVTSAYRKKLEELRQVQEKEKHEEYLEAIGDVTKQKDLDGFYRHLYEQKLGTSKNEPQKTDEISKEIKSSKNVQQRAYRKRHSSDEENEVEEKSTEAKKVHLPNNIDADSDFSIDSSSSEDEDDKPGTSKTHTNPKSTKETCKDDKEEVSKIENKANESNLTDNDKKDEKEIPEKPSTPKIDIWKKRTVGEVFEAALQRYYERKAARRG